MPGEAAQTQILENGQVILNSVGALKAMADPLRLQIVLELTDATQTVKEMAKRLEVPQTRLYYHFKILEKAGLIKVVSTRMVSGIEERHYRAAASGWTPDVETVPALVKEGVIGAMLKVVRAELELALTTPSETPVGTPESPVPVLTFTRWLLTPNEAEDMEKQIIELLERVADNESSEDRRAYHALLAWYEAPDEIRNRGADAS